MAMVSPGLMPCLAKNSPTQALLRKKRRGLPDFASVGMSV
jgi:hypothetical protein